ncbi:hypothetical protein L6452_01071 [Arctium lappa]|uniref:Uncharacterized protein n=1 Tax=Arctium lappa TaxID=4217 RepID=A0ACB9FGH0_ARCLA|nr:hypothetical protein L6452_01071 [Arctium lappa]
MSIAELACSYTCLILSDDAIPIMIGMLLIAEVILLLLIYKQDFTSRRMIKADVVEMTKVQGCIARSRLVPVLNEDISIKRMDSFFRVIPSTPQVKVFDTVSPTPSPARDVDNEEGDGEDIPEVEVVCRICLVELCEGSETLKNGMQRQR